MILSGHQITTKIDTYNSKNDQKKHGKQEWRCCMTREHGDERSTNELGVAAEVGEAKVIFGTNFELVCRS